MPTNYTLTQASQLLQSKQISAVELATEYLAAINAQNPAINGYITLDPEKTLAEARAADERIAQGNAHALTGVPIAYKDIFCQIGWRTACASKMLDNLRCTLHRHRGAKSAGRGHGNAGAHQYGRICHGFQQRNFVLRRGAQS